MATETKTQIVDKPLTRPEPSFWDSWPALVLMVIAIIGGRMYILEPFKIPSGSMEPTLFGHEDYGDRILTNKLAFVTAQHALLVLGASVVVIAIGFVASKAWQRWRSIINFSLLSLLVVGGILLAWSRGAVADEPRRFDVVVFQYETDWNLHQSGQFDRSNNKKINYIKRLVGLPGETIVISGGDLFKYDKIRDTYEIIRKWESNESLQQTLWYPVAKAWHPDGRQLTPEDRKRLQFPWLGAEEGTPGVKLEEKALQLDGSATVELNYKYPITNVYLKQGRWPYRHDKCPAANLPGKDGFRNPENKSELMSAYVANTWEGIQCPNCGQVMFPATRNPVEGPILVPRQSSEDRSLPPEFTNFFYGGNRIVNDLKLEIELEVESPGDIHVEVGNNLHRARWTLPVSGGDDAGGVHPVKAATPALAPGRHTLSLAYVDATVIATLDGQEIERRKIDNTFPLNNPNYSNVVKLKFDKTKARLTRLDVFRDLFYTPTLYGDNDMSSRQRDLRRVENGNYIAQIPKDHFLMLGDNAPSSSDGRLWGYVPRENLSGRAWVIWWPPSRWRVIK